MDGTYGKQLCNVTRPHITMSLKADVAVSVIKYIASLLFLVYYHLVAQTLSSI
jgi:hypothetical protein